MQTCDNKERSRTVPKFAMYTGSSWKHGWSATMQTMLHDSLVNMGRQLQCQHVQAANFCPGYHDIHECKQYKHNQTKQIQYKWVQTVFQG